MKYLLVGLFSCVFSILYGLYKEKRKNKKKHNVKTGKILPNKKIKVEW
jgi:D-alanyl-lipoteichoic acid acyltransferase DltB (MBOAT superfamily)